MWERFGLLRPAERCRSRHMVRRTNRRTSNQPTCAHDQRHNARFARFSSDDMSVLPVPVRAVWPELRVERLPFGRAVDNCGVPPLRAATRYVGESQHRFHQAHVQGAYQNAAGIYEGNIHKSLVNGHLESRACCNTDTRKLVYLPLATIIGRFCHTHLHTRTRTAAAVCLLTHPCQRAVNDAA